MSSEIFPLYHMNRGCTRVLVIYHQRFDKLSKVMFSKSTKGRNHPKTTLTLYADMNLVVTIKQLPQLISPSVSGTVIILNA